MTTQEQRQIKPLKADKFLQAALQHLEPLRGTYIYAPIRRDYHEKTGQQEAGYARWLGALLPSLLRDHARTREARILDFGCGTGELTVLMNSLGFHVTGTDIHTEHLRLARILAEENGLPPETFVQGEAGAPLPFEDDSFDVVTLFVVLEHLSDPILNQILPELRRVCRGAVFVLVPSKLQLRDDHTGLKYVPWMPRWLATRYIKAHGPKRQYFISEDGSWDVHYRTLGRIQALFARQGFALSFPPDDLVFPSLDSAVPLYQPAQGPGSRLRALRRLPFQVALRLGARRQAFYPYFNLIFTKQGAAADRPV